jgi:hypothetical protein
MAWQERPFLCLSWIVDERRCRSFSLCRSLFMFHIPEHFSPSVASDIHPHNNAPHTDQGGSPHTSSPASVTSGTDFPSAGASGKPTGLLGNLSAFPSEYTSVANARQSANRLYSGAGEMRITSGSRQSPMMPCPSDSRTARGRVRGRRARGSKAARRGVGIGRRHDFQHVGSCVCTSHSR